MSFAKIRPRRGTATQWTTANPILAEGEIGIEVPDSGVGTGIVKMKFGDGVTAWNDLPYGVVEPLTSGDIVNNAVTDNSKKVVSASVAKDLQDQINLVNKTVDTTNDNIKNISPRTVIARYTNANSAFTFKGAEYSIYNLVSMGMFTEDNCNAEIAIMTYPNVGRRIWYRSSHGATLTDDWLPLPTLSETVGRHTRDGLNNEVATRTYTLTANESYILTLKGAGNNIHAVYILYTDVTVPLAIPIISSEYWTVSLTTDHILSITNTLTTRYSHYKLTRL